LASSELITVSIFAGINGILDRTFLEICVCKFTANLELIVLYFGIRPTSSKVK
jgi:hypothetical protein